MEVFVRLRDDAVLAELLCHGLPSQEAARKILYRFHD